MDTNTEFLIKELFDEAKQDSSWEEDPVKREMYANMLYSCLLSSLT